MPGYLQLSQAELSCRVERLNAMLSHCTLCPHECGADRRNGETGKCGMGAAVLVSSDNLHFGEEPCLVGYGGSGTIFLTGCNLSCCFCQNYPISQLRHGREVCGEELAAIMARLQKEGAVNINFVSPTHFTAQVVEAIAIAREQGLCVPIVWNSGGYERVEVIREMDGIIDIYLPDAKYADDGLAARLSGAPAYSTANQAVIREMWRQVGALDIQDGIAVRGLLVRHLVIPGQVENSLRVLEFLAGIDKELAVSVMCQYFPAYKALDDKSLARKVSAAEWARIREKLESLGINEGYLQELSG
jgi:putative pyruvate formate lyase activating enzyme